MIHRCLSDCACAKFLPTRSTDKDTQQTPSTCTKNDENCCSGNNVDDNECAKVTQPPLYSVPDKLKSKKALKSSDSKLESDHTTTPLEEKSNDVKGLQIEEVVVHLYMSTNMYMHTLHNFIMYTVSHAHINPHTHQHNIL